MKVTTWIGKIGENGKVMPGKVDKVIDENLILDSMERFKGLTR